MQPSVPNYKEFTFRDTELSIMNLLLIKKNHNKKMRPSLAIKVLFPHFPFYRKSDSTSLCGVLEDKFCFRKMN